MARWVLPTPDGPEQHDVLGALDEARARELLDLRLRRAAGEAEVVALERLHRRQRRELQQRLADALGAGRPLGTEHALEEVGEGGLLVRGALRERRPLGVDGGQLQQLAQLRDALGLQAHAATSSSAS